MFCYINGIRYILKCKHETTVYTIYAFELNINLMQYHPYIREALCIIVLLPITVLETKDKKLKYSNSKHNILYTTA